MRSDLHFIDGYLPTMRSGDVIGHEFMGEVIETGPEVSQVSVGQRVVVPSFIGCGSCWYCRYAGSHAEYVRVPFADNDCIPIPDAVQGDQAMFLSDAAWPGKRPAQRRSITPPSTASSRPCTR